MMQVRRKVYGVPRDQSIRRTPYPVRLTYKENIC